MHAECFPKEISFLKYPGNTNIHDLVKDLNLYIDKGGVLDQREELTRM